MNACDHGSEWSGSLGCARFSAMLSGVCVAVLAFAAQAAGLNPSPGVPSVSERVGSGYTLPAVFDGWSGQDANAEGAWQADEQTIADGRQSCPPRWTASIDAMMLWQGNAQSVPLFLDASGATAFNAQDLRTQMAVGARGAVQRTFGPCHAIEGIYFQARPFNAASELPPGGGPYELVNTGDLVFNDIEAARVTSNGWIQSAECNWRMRRPDSPLVWIAGFRWIELNSSINVDYTFANPVPYGSGSILSDCGNNLYGGQFGGDLLLWNKGGPWRVNCVGKAGVFYNSVAYQRSSAGFVTDTGDDFPLGTVSAAADQTAFFGEIGLNAQYRVTEWLSLRVGYSFYWATGVAVAARQLPLNNFGDLSALIDTESNLLLQGATTGLEARW